MTCFKGSASESKWLRQMGGSWRWTILKDNKLTKGMSNPQERETTESEEREIKRLSDRVEPKCLYCRRKEDMMSREGSNRGAENFWRTIIRSFARERGRYFDEEDLKRGPTFSSLPPGKSEIVHECQRGRD